MCGKGCGVVLNVLLLSHRARDEGAWYRADLRLLEIETGEVRRLYTPTDQLSWISANVSGTWIAAAEGCCSDRGILAGTLILVDARSGRPQRVDTHGIDVTHTEWLTDQRVLIAGHRGFENAVALYDRESGLFEEIWKS